MCGACVRVRVSVRACVRACVCLCVSLCPCLCLCECARVYIRSSDQTGQATATAGGGGRSLSPHARACALFRPFPRWGRPREGEGGAGTVADCAEQRGSWPSSETIEPLRTPFYHGADCAERRAALRLQELVRLSLRTSTNAEEGNKDEDGGGASGGGGAKGQRLLRRARPGRDSSWVLATMLRLPVSVAL